MGTHKLLLPWPITEDLPLEVRSSYQPAMAPVIDRVLTAWTHSSVTATIVVIRRGDHELLAACRRFPIEVVSPPDDPLDMKASIQVGLSYVRQRYSPTAKDRFLVAPADLPQLNSRLIDQVVDFAATESQVVVPRFANKSGHPVSLPWSLADQVCDLPAHLGLDALIERYQVVGPQLPADLRVTDIDTPQEYRQALEQASPKAKPLD